MFNPEIRSNATTAETPEDTIEKEELATPEITQEQLNEIGEVAQSEQDALEAIPTDESPEKSARQQAIKRKFMKIALGLTLFTASFAATMGTPGNAEARRLNRSSSPYGRAVEQGVSSAIRGIFTDARRNVQDDQRAENRVSRERNQLYKAAFRDYSQDLKKAGDNPAEIDAAKVKYDARIHAIDELIRSGRF